VAALFAAFARGADYHGPVDVTRLPEKDRWGYCVEDYEAKMRDTPIRACDAGGIRTLLKLIDCEDLLNLTIPDRIEIDAAVDAVAMLPSAIRPRAV
jgi:hypothetical protein